MAQGQPRPGEQYLHFKNKLYQVIAVARHADTDEAYVVYQALYDDFAVYVRPYREFIGEVDHEKYPHVTQTWRFAYRNNLEQQESISEHPLQEKESVADESAVSAAAPQETDEEGSGGINPWLDRFLDAESFSEKYQLICDMRADVTDKLIDDLAAVMDVVIPEGRLADRYKELRACAQMKQKYEISRLR